MNQTVNVAQSGEDWISVFQNRGVWDLTRERVDGWIHQNKSFFELISLYVRRSGKILELGCGPGRHALGEAILGYEVLGVDVDARIVEQARANAEKLGLACVSRFQTGDMYQLMDIAPIGTFDGITHGGVMEHLPSAQFIRDTLHDQLKYSPVVIFDVPVDTPKNRRLFERDTIFRQMWAPDYWVEVVLKGLPVADSRFEQHPQEHMTDDLVVALRRA